MGGTGGTGAGAPAGGVTMLADESANKKWSSWWRRVQWSFVMVGGFNLLFLYGQQLGLVLLVVVGQAFIYRELVQLAIRYNKERELPGFNAFYYYWFFVAAFYSYGRTLMPHLLRHATFTTRYPVLAALLQNHMAISFVLYMAGFVGFVISLKKRKLYRYQFQQYAYCHMAALVVVGQSTFMAANVFEGLIWFFLPVSLVVCNDCFAYIFGFFLGRTPLIRLSPKKTWEGFLGGFAVTVLYGFVAAGVLQRYPFMTCPRSGFDTVPLDWDCAAASTDAAAGPGATSGSMHMAHIFRLHPFQEFLPYVVSAALPSFVASYQVSAMQLHAVIMAIFASLVAPFGGFFASGFKRAFGIKDFADVIPGHGGFTDRMDCQIIMGFFSFVYLQTVVAPYAAPALLGTILSRARPDQEYIFAQLAEALGKTCS